MAKEKSIVTIAIVAILAVLVLSGVVMYATGTFNTTDESSNGISTGGVNLAGISCPDDLSTTGTLTVYNGLNTATSETFDNTAYLYKVDANGAESYVSTITDTTSGAVTLDCGSQYRVRMVSSDAESGDSGVITGSRSGFVTVSPDGKYAEFVAEGATQTIELESKQHAILKFKAFDNKQNGFMYDSGDASATDYEFDGVTFKSTSGNTTATALGVGESLDVTLSVRGNTSDGDFASFGMYILVDASTSEFDEPTIRFEGTKLSDVKGSLTKAEEREYTDYDYIYLLPAGATDVIVDNSDYNIDIVIPALENANPTTDVQVDFASIGAVKQIASNGVVYAGTNDASSQATIFAVQDVTFDLS